MDSVTIGPATLYCGDCFEVMEGLEAVDHAISDPPYEEVFQKAAGRVNRTDGGAVGQGFGFDGIDGVREQAAAEFVRLARKWVFAFCLAEGVRAWRDALQAVGGKYDTCCGWIKPDSLPRMNGQGPARGFECAVTAWAGPGYRHWNGGGKRGVYTHLVNAGRHGGHPTEKPLPLMREIITDFTAPGELVLDPFMGIGTTGVACVQLGRRFIGIERERKWFDIACKRIEDADKRPDMFVDYRPMKQTGLDFGEVG